MLIVNIYNSDNNSDSYLSVIIAGIAVIVSVIALFITRRITRVAYEFSSYSILTNAKEKINEIQYKLIPLLVKKKASTLTDTEVMELEYLNENFELALENSLNAYDEICAKFISGKIDKKYFKRMYKNEINGICEGGEFDKYLSASADKYEYIKRAYNKLNNEVKYVFY